MDPKGIRKISNKMNKGFREVVKLADPGYESEFEINWSTEISYWSGYIQGLRDAKVITPTQKKQLENHLGMVRDNAWEDSYSRMS